MKIRLAAIGKRVLKHEAAIAPSPERVEQLLSQAPASAHSPKEAAEIVRRALRKVRSIDGRQLASLRRAS